MKNRANKWLGSLMFSIGATGFVGATGIEQTFQDASAAGRANAVVASIHDPSAVHYNPAGLVYGERVESQTTLYLNRGYSSYSGPVGEDRHYTTSPSFSYFLNYPGLYDGKLAFGLGLTIPHGLGVDFGDDYLLRTLSVEAFLAHLVVTPAISYKINDKLSIGMTLNYAYDDYLLRQGIVVPGDEFKFEGTGDGWGYSVGVMYQATEKLSFGLNYRSKIRTDIDGTATTTTVLPVAGILEEDASAGLEYPQLVVLGAAYRLNDKWDFEVNFQWTDWTSFDQFTISKASGNLTADQDYEEAYFVSAGATYRLNERTKLNFGYLYATPAAPQSTYNPFVANAELHILSFGVDHVYKDWEFSSSILYNYGVERSVSGSTVNPISGISADGDWKARSLILMFDITKKF